MVVAAGCLAWRSLRLRSSDLFASGSHAHRWLILAPHPDDETLGAGGLISQLVARGSRTWVVFLTAGDASHSNAPDWPPERIARTRRREALRALGALGHPGARTLFLDWPDGRPHGHRTMEFRQSADRLARLCRRAGIRNLATTWRGEGHCDHQAAFRLAHRVADHSRGAVRLFEYLVWGWTEPALASAVRDFDAYRVDNAAHLAARVTAISSHRTQLSPMIRNAYHAFRLPANMISLARRDPTIFLRKRVGNAA
jgi:LmbE family N-acetylglucosaminyl deacetylase